MKWLLIVMAMDGSVSSVEFETERACMSALIKLNLLSAHHILSGISYMPHVDVFCIAKGASEQTLD